MSIAIVILLMIAVLYVPFFLEEWIDDHDYGGWWEIPTFDLIFLGTVFVESFLWCLADTLIKTAIQ